VKVWLKSRSQNLFRKIRQKILSFKETEFEIFLEELFFVDIRQPAILFLSHFLTRRRCKLADKSCSNDARLIKNNKL